MKRKTPILVYGITCILFLFALGFLLFYEEFFASISFVDVAKERTELIDGIESYQSPEELRKFFGHKVSSWEVIENDKLDKSDKRSPYHIYRVLIKDYSCLGFSGELSVTFFNNRLERTCFYPLKPDKFIDALIKDKGVEFDKEQKAEIPPFTRIWVAIDYKDRKYVGWKDIRLSKEVDIWTYRYA